MAFGIPGTSGDGGGDFLPRLQYDSRVGMWKRVERKQDSSGSWFSDEEMLDNPKFVLDFRAMEVGFFKIASPPVFVMVPYGEPLPVQPDPSMKGGIRVRLMLKEGLHTYSTNAKTVLPVVEAIHKEWAASPEAADDKLPVVACTGKTPVKVRTPEGNSTFYAPELKITGYVARTDAYREPLCPLPVKPGAAAPAQQAAKHTPPPAPVAAADDDDLPF